MVKEALKYPLSPIPLSLNFPDGTKRSPAKSSLMKIIDYTQVVEDDAYVNVSAYIVDLMAAIRAVVRHFLDSRKAAHQPSTIHHSKRLRKSSSYREISWENSTSAAKR